MIRQVTVLIDGALADERYFHTDGAAAAYYRQLEREAPALPVGTQMVTFEVPHPHDDLDEECACVQYQIDHSPTRTFEGQGLEGVTV